LLLQILEDGILTDNKGKTVNFENTVVIMTSNVGANLIEKQSQLGFKAAADDDRKSYEKMKEKVINELRRTFRPEFLNRLDETIVFHSLNKEHIKEIVDLMLDDLKTRLKQKNIEVEINEDVKEKLLDEGYDAEYGARPLRRAIQRLIENPLSSKLLSGEINNNDTIEIKEKDGELIFARL